MTAQNDALGALNNRLIMLLTLTAEFPNDTDIEELNEEVMILCLRRKFSEAGHGKAAEIHRLIERLDAVMTAKRKEGSQ